MSSPNDASASEWKRRAMAQSLRLLARRSPVGPSFVHGDERRRFFPFAVHPTEIFFEPDDTSPLDLRCETNAEDCRTRWLDEWHRPLNVSSIDQVGFYHCEICCRTGCRNSSSLIYPVRLLATISSPFDLFFLFRCAARRAEIRPFCFFLFSKRRSVEAENRKRKLICWELKDGTKCCSIVHEACRYFRKANSPTSETVTVPRPTYVQKVDELDFF